MTSTRLPAMRWARWPLAVAFAVGVLPTSAHAAGLNLFPEVELVALNIVLFLALIYPVNRLLVQPLLAVLDERERRTQGAESDAEGLHGAALDARKRLEAALIETRARAQARRAAILSAGETDERALLDAARNDALATVESMRTAVAGELAAARTALEADTRALAQEAASRILGRAL